MTSLHAEDKNENRYTSKARGKYKFGDISKTLIKKITKKDEYEFGDLSKHLDKQAKNKVASLSKKEDYEFGDLTRLVRSRIGDEVQDFTNKDKYKFGNITKEIARRVATKDYTFDDLILLFKILLAFGAGLSPVANFLPAKLLIELLDYSIVGDVSSKVIAAITTELDRRMKKVVTGDEDYKLGDLSKNRLMKYIGKEDGKYEFGDITRFVLDNLDSKDNGEDKVQPDRKKQTEPILGRNTDELLTQELEEWDKNFLIQYNETAIIDAEVINTKKV